MIMKTSVEIWSIRNPMWLADTFVFAYHNDFKCYVYIKVNFENKIEEVGIDLERRMHGVKFENMLSKEKASELHKSIFNCIGDEYWHKMNRYYGKD